jgi:hypothetical protein
MIQYRPLWKSWGLQISRHEVMGDGVTATRHALDVKFEVQILVAQLENALVFETRAF